MNKYYIDAVIVVEGKSDVSYLSSFIDSLFFITNGYDINEEKLNFLSRVSEVNKLIVLTDNDEAGKQIGNKIKLKINGCFVVKTEKITRNCYKKSGVAETTKDEIIRVLSPFIDKSGKSLKIRKYDLSKIISLSNDPQEIRNKIIKDFRLIDGNNKFLENQLNMLNVDEVEFKKKYGN